MLNTAKVKLDLIRDPDTYVFFEKGIMRDGISYISNKYSKPNNKNFKSNYPKKESKHIIYLEPMNL